MNKNVPEIRFQGFHDDWEQRKLGEITGIYDGTHQTPNYISEGVMFLSVENIKDLQSNKYISKADFDKNFKVYPEKGDILMTRIGDIGTPNIVQTEDPLAYYVSLALLKPKNLSSYFLKSSIETNYIQRELWQRTLHIAFPKKINKNEINKVSIYVPEFQEQKQIGKFIKKIDNLITLHQRKLNLLQLQKKGLLQKMFPKKDEKSPKLRFNGFVSDWEQRKLGDEFEKINERNNGLFGKDRWISVAKMYFQDVDKVQTNNIDTRTYVMRKGDMAFEGNKSKDFKYGRFVVNTIGDGVVSELFPIYRHKSQYDLMYWKFAIHIDDIMAPIFAKALTSSGTSSNKLNNRDLLKQAIGVPTILEQHQMGLLLGKEDKMITLYQHKIDALQEQKKGLLQKMFV